MSQFSGQKMQVLVKEGTGAGNALNIQVSALTYLILIF